MYTAASSELIAWMGICNISLCLNEVNEIFNTASSFASTANILGNDLAYVLKFPTYRAYTNDSAMSYEGLAYSSFVLPTEILN